MADLTPAEELRAAATRTRCEHTHSAAPPHSIWAPSPCEKCAAPYDAAPRDVPERLREPLANLLDDLADEAEATYATEVHLGPDAIYATGVVDYRGELCSDLTHALATARTILGVAEQPGGEPAPAEQPVTASTLHPDMVVSHPTWNDGHRVRIVTAHDDGSQMVIHYRDVRVRRPDAVKVVPRDFQVTPGAGFEPHTTPTPSKES